MAAPLCVGYTSLPLFLRRDWLPEYSCLNRPYLTWSVERYRDIYTNAKKKCCKKHNSDAKYTEKSASIRHCWQCSTRMMTLSRWLQSYWRRSRCFGG
ncbi:hypothetical protein DE146DRAFT_663128 [Phaeosphaeria sp. MPI-PUGE-AT-0046c]|nr:hypothetical protein DE146DRAFT_663128 [Phaeosphaeria sp. MPI-PUGE-AT-0046c]